MIKNFDYVKKKGLIDTKQSEMLHERFDLIFNQNLHKNLISGICEFEKDNILKEPLFIPLLNKIHAKFESILNKNDLVFEKLWLVSSSPSKVDGNALPYVPHIDKDRSLKAMIYLHDVTIKHGPIHMGKVKNNINIESMRKKLPHDYQIKKLNIINDEYLDGDLNPMTGKAGDVIFFDTNAPHKAGKLQDGFYRKVLRFKFKSTSFSPKPFILNRIAKRIKKMI